MFKIRGKRYWPTSFLTKFSLGIVFLSGFAVEGAQSLEALILPGILIIVFGLIALSGVCNDET